MRVRILKTTTSDSINGFSLLRLEPGRVYDLPPTLADYLVVSGIGAFEMRVTEKPLPPQGQERRHEKPYIGPK